MSVIPWPADFSLSAALWVGAILFLLLAVWSVLQSRYSSERRDIETIEWGRPRPSLIQRWRVRFRLPRFSQRQMPEIAPKPAASVPANAPADPLKKPTQPMLALFGSTVNGSTIGAPETKPKQAFVWAKTKGIE